MRYEIDPVTYAISIFDDGATIPFHYQPDYPNGDQFDTFEEAESWAQASIAAHQPEATHHAPIGKNVAPHPIVDEATESLKLKLKSLGLTDDEIFVLSRIR
jgi:hypothetical protein